MSFQLTDKETVLPDDYPVYGDYVYIIDGVFKLSNLISGTVADLKRMEKAEEIRRCDLFAHEGAKLGDKVC